MKLINIIILLLSLTIFASSCTFYTGYISNTDNTDNTESSDQFDTAADSTNPQITTPEATTTPQINTPELTTTQIQSDIFPPEIDDTIVSQIIENVQATNAFVYNVTQDKLIAIKENGEKISPASITKLLSIQYALSVTPQELEITPHQDELSLVGTGSSIAYIKSHHRLTVAQLVKGMLLPSGNDAAYTLAAGVGRYISNNAELSGKDAVDLFVENMNEYAESLGCKDTVFTVPDGLAGNEHYTSLHDLIIIGKESLKCSLITEYSKIVSERVRYASGHYMTWNNTNRLINPNDSYYSPYVTGLKTGSLTDNYCLYISAEINEQIYLIGIFSSPTKTSRYDDAHMLINALLEMAA